MEKKILPGQKRNADTPVLKRLPTLYCFYRAFISLGLLVENKIYHESDIIEFCHDNNVGLIFNVGGFSVPVNESAPTLYTVLVTNRLDHVISVQYYDNRPITVSDHISLSHFHLASDTVVKTKVRERRRRPRAKVDLVKVTEEIVEKRKKPEIYRTKTGETRQVIVTEKPAINSMKVTKKEKKARAPIVRSGISAQALVAQSLDPYSTTVLLRYPDGEAKKVAIQKSSANLDFTAVAFQFPNDIVQYYLSVIHSGTLKSQFFTNAVAFTLPNLEFALAALRVGSNAVLEDDTPMNPQCNPLQQEINPASTTTMIVIPLHSSVSEEFDGAGRIVASAYIQAGETYDASNTLIQYPILSFGENFALALATNTAAQELLTISLQGTCNTNATLTLYLFVSLGNGTVQNVALGTINLTTSTPNFYNSITTTFHTNASLNFPNIGGVNFDKMHGVGFTCSVNGVAVALLDQVNVTLVTNNQPIASITGSVISQPFSRYNGTPVPDINTILPLSISYRNIASSLLISDFTNQFQVSGILNAVQINSPQYPSEYSVGGIVSCGNKPGNFSGREAKGVYSSPVKIISVESRVFNKIVDDWSGLQPYTATFAYLPQPAVTATTVPAFAVRVQVCDIFEIYMVNQQIFEVSSVKENDRLVKYLEARSLLLCENDFHLGEIGRFLAQAARVALPVVEQVAIASGNKYLMGAATVGRALLN